MEKSYASYAPGVLLGKLGSGTDVVLLSQYIPPLSLINVVLLTALLIKLQGGARATWVHTYISMASATHGLFKLES